MKDYSEYLNKPGMLEWIESEWINKPEIHDFHASVLNKFIKGLKKGKKNQEVLEIGCGTGNLVKRLDWDIYYTGIDANEECIKLAKKKNPEGPVFVLGDVRQITYKDAYDLVFTFGVLKHFGLHEWNEIFEKICTLGEYLVFDIPIGDKVTDDGVEHHHVWFTMDAIKDQIEKNGFEILEINNEMPIEPVFICKRK